MGDKKPKKTSSGNSDAHKAKAAKHQADRPPMPTNANDRAKKRDRN